MIKVRFLPAAELELLHEVSYFSQARSGTGLRFQSAVEATVLRARRYPSGGAPSSHETRSMLVKGFPFSVVYRPSSAELLVVAVAAHRRRADYWASRLTSNLSD